MADLETLLTYLTLISVPIGVFYHIMTLANTRKNQDLQLETRQTQLFMQIYMRYLEPDLFSSNFFKLMSREWDDSQDYVNKYGVGGDVGASSPDGADLNMLMTFYEGVAVLLNRKMIDMDLVYELMPTNVTALWGKYESLIKAFRASGGAPPKLYILVEELSAKITSHAEELGDPVMSNYGSSSDE